MMKHYLIQIVDGEEVGRVEVDTSNPIFNAETRTLAYRAIDSERNYQLAQVNDPARTDMRELTMGEAVAVLGYLHGVITTYWYSDSEPYGKTMQYVRKMAGVCVAMMEKHGVSLR